MFCGNRTAEGVGEPRSVPREGRPACRQVVGKPWVSQRVRFSYPAQKQKRRIYPSLSVFLQVGYENEGWVGREAAGSLPCRRVVENRGFSRRELATDILLSRTKFKKRKRPSLGKRRALTIVLFVIVAVRSGSRNFGT